MNKSHSSHHEFAAHLQGSLSVSYSAALVWLLAWGGVYMAIVPSAVRHDNLQYMPLLLSVASITGQYLVLLLPTLVPLLVLRNRFAKQVLLVG